MLELYRQTGKRALGSRLRQLSETLGEQAARAYRLYDGAIDPKWFPVFYMLKSGDCLSISAIAGAIGHSHASVSKIVKEMAAADIVISEKVPGDGRINQVCLTEKGKQLVSKFLLQAEDVEAVVEELMLASQNNLWEAVSEIEYLLSEQDLYSRIKEKYLIREQNKIQLVNFDAKYAQVFHDLNFEWIEKYFTLEESDRVMLDAPQKTILDRGGYIVIALYQDEPVGTCALIKHDDERFELAKMAVSDDAKGKSIGFLMGRDIIQKARELGAERIFLESNTRLVPALNLYKKLGFARVVSEPSPYSRCNIQMEIEL